MIGADIELRRRPSTTAAREMPVAQPKRRQFSVEDGGLLEIVFFAIKVTFVGSQFPTDFDSRNRRLCSRRSRGPLLRAFCVCFHFQQHRRQRADETHAETLAGGRQADGPDAQGDGGGDRRRGVQRQRSVDANSQVCDALPGRRSFNNNNNNNNNNKKIK